MMHPKLEFYGNLSFQEAFISSVAPTLMQQAVQPISVCWVLTVDVVLCKCRKAAIITKTLAHENDPVWFCISSVLGAALLMENLKVLSNHVLVTKGLRLR